MAANSWNPNATGLPAWHAIAAYTAISSNRGWRRRLADGCTADTGRLDLVVFSSLFPSAARPAAGLFPDAASAARRRTAHRCAFRLPGRRCRDPAGALARLAGDPDLAWHRSAA